MLYFELIELVVVPLSCRLNSYRPHLKCHSSVINFLDAANANALKLSCELLRVFITEAVQRAATIAEAEGVSKIEATHLERILPQLLLDF
ncbi:Centromere protein X [Morella rubra]|uniref:Centromere protein X n=1 Tax=Morella rubra TaxID=262757 RepID=A0A6A1VYZ7_9ROSI|nr:Centromere protein X [Morella rubra]